MTEDKRKVEVCFSPVMFSDFRNDSSVVVIVDILRATSAIVTAFMNGVKTHYSCRYPGRGHGL